MIRMDNDSWRRAWQVPTLEQLTAAFDKARADQALVIYLTIILKMRMSHNKREFLLSAHKRVTNMKALVFALFQADLESICADQTKRHLVDDIIAATEAHAANKAALSADERIRIRTELEHLQQGKDDLAFIEAVIHALVASSQELSRQQSGISLLHAEIQRWQTLHSNKRLQTTLEKAEKKNWSSEDLLRLKYSVLLRRYLETAPSTQTDVLLVVSLVEAQNKKLGDGAELLCSMLSRCYSRVCTSRLFPLGGTLRDSLFSDCAETLVGWCEKVIGYLEGEIDAQIHLQPDNRKAEKHALWQRFRYKRVTKIVELYQMWSAAELRYRNAAAEKMPFGPHEGKSFGNSQKQARRKRTVLGPGVLGKKGTRRLLRQLLPPEVVEHTLIAVDRLLFPKRCTDEELAEAKRVPHPWWRRKVRRGVEANPLLQQPSATKFRSIPLFQLSQNQLWNLRAQLLEMGQLAVQFDQIKAAAELFVRGAPPSFPSIETALLTAEELEQLPVDLRRLLPQPFEDLYDAYTSELNWFRDFRPSRGEPQAIYAPEHLYDIETLAFQRLEQAAAPLQESKLQPLWFKRTSSADLSTRSFGLLYYGRSRKGQNELRFIFLIELANAHASEYRKILQAKRAEQLPVCRHVNYPEVSFELPPELALVFFPLEFGDKHQGRLLQEALREQQLAPKKCAKGCLFKVTGTHLPDCQPKAVLATATVAIEQREHSQPDWFVHLPIPIGVPPTTMNPSRIVGYHEHWHGYSYAVVDVEGNVLECGDMSPPSHVGPDYPEGQKSDNYAFEMAVQLARMARQVSTHSYIGIEDTTWRKATISLSASENRVTFRQPSQRIFEITTYKARMEGLLAPIATRGVAPTRDCGRCGHRLNDNHGVRRHAVTYCYDCAIRGQLSTLEKAQNAEGQPALRCTACQKHWPRWEYEFKCTACGWRMLSRYNTAIVVARRTLRQLVNDILYKKIAEEEAAETA